MALLRPITFIDLKARYLAAKASWKVASKELASNPHERISLQEIRSILKKTTAAYSQYLHKNRTTLKPLSSANSIAIETRETELLATLNSHQQNIHHIAISGPQGVGKRSFLYRFAQRNRQYHSITLSLSSVTETPDHLTPEQSITHQLLLAATSKKPPQPPRQFTPVRRYPDAIVALVTCSALAVLGYTHGVSGVDQSVTVKALQHHLPDALLMALKKYAPLLAELSLFALTAALVLLLSNGVRRLLGGAVIKSQAAPGQPTKTSYVDQLAQQFMQIKQPLVIIENLTHIDELKALHRLNRQLNHRNKKPVRFIYALDDELLTDRTRWFDLIIPIVPALTSSNGTTTLCHQLSNLNISHQHKNDDGGDTTEFPDQTLVAGIADYLDDPRITTNIVNEFAVYHGQLTRKLPLLDKNKLLAMMVIKTLYPREHAALCGNTGIFARIFTDFRRHKQQAPDEYTLGIAHDQKVTGQQQPAVITSQPQRTKKLADSSLAEALKQEIVDDSLLGELTDVSFGPVPWLIKNGYFAEDYRDYLSSFQPGVITLADKRLALELAAGQSVEFTKHIDSPKALLNQLKPSDLACGRGLINSLVTELLDQPASDYNGYPVDSFLLALFDLPERHFARLAMFIVQYQQDTSSQMQKLFQNLLSINRSVLTHCVSSDYSAHSAEIIAQVLMALTVDELKTMSGDLVPAINNLENIQPIVQHSAQRPDIWCWLKDNEIQFHRLSLKDCSQEIAHKIINGAVYRMNAHMLGLLLAFTREQRPTTLARVSYSAICACGHEALTAQVEENLALLVNQVLLNLPRQTEYQEEQHYLTQLLNAPQLEIADKLKLLAHFRQTITAIEDIVDQDLRTELFAANLAAPTWNNVRHLFDTPEVDSLLLQFITRPEHLEQLSRQNQSDTPHPDHLLAGLVHNKDIGDSTLEKLLATFPAIAIEHFDPESISATRLATVLQHPGCRFSLSGLSWLARNEPLFDTDSTYQYTIRFWHDYKAATDNTTHLTVGTITRLLSGDDIHVNDQLWLCDLLNHEQENDQRILQSMITLILAQPSESFTLKISSNRLGALLAAANSREEKVKLLSMQAKHLSWPEISTLLAELAIVPVLSQESFQFSLTDTPENNQLINALRQANHIVAIHATEHGEDVIKAYIKRSAAPEPVEISSSAGRTAQ